MFTSRAGENCRSVETRAEMRAALCRLGFDSSTVVLMKPAAWIEPMRKKVVPVFARAREILEPSEAFMPQSELVRQRSLRFNPEYRKNRRYRADLRDRADGNHPQAEAHAHQPLRSAALNAPSPCLALLSFGGFA
jgi:hypothetical protein